MNDVELAWVAGLLEGEGWFSIRKPALTKTGEPKNYRQVNVTCGMTDRDVVERLRATVGFGTIFQDRRSRSNPNNKDLHTWRATRRSDVEPFLRRLQPLMGERRSARIGELLAYFDEHPPVYRKNREKLTSVQAA